MPRKKRMPVIVMGNGHYEKEERKKKDKKQQKADNVYLKGQTSGFDIKV